jgi:gamma-glutamylcysteine synthetase
MTVALQIKGARVAEVEGEGPDAELLSAAWAGLLYDGAMLAAAAERVPGLSPAFRTALAAALRREVPSMGLKP